MTSLSDRDKRMELVERYLNAETSIEEERLLLDYYMKVNTGLSPEEEDVRMVILLTARLANYEELSDEKERIFDQLMKRSAMKRVKSWHKSPGWILGALSLVAAALLAFVFIPKTSRETVVEQPLAKSMAPAPSFRLQQDSDGVAQQMGNAENQLIDLETPGKLSPETPLLAQAMQTNEQEATSSDSDSPSTKTSEHEALPPSLSRGVSPQSPSVTMEDDAQFSCVITSSDGCMKISVAHFGGFSTDRNTFDALNNEDYAEDWRYSDAKAIRLSEVEQVEHGVARAYDEHGMDGVMSYLSEKTKKAENPIVYKIDGKRVSKEVFDKLSPDDIKEIQILKRGSAAAIKEGPHGWKNDIILVTTRQNSSAKEQSSAPSSFYRLRNPFETGADTCLL